MRSREQYEDAVREFYGARDNGDVKAMMTLFDPECRFRIAGGDNLSQVTQEVRGEELRSAVEKLVKDWDLSRLEITSFHVDGSTVFVHRSGLVRYNPSGEEILTELLDKLTFRNGLMVDYLEFVDTLTVAETIGLFDT